jgi:uncharacterized YceG family protein
MKNILLTALIMSFSISAQNKDIIEVRVGERVSDFISRLNNKSILSNDAVEQILNENESLKLFDFVPYNKTKGAIALEGIFVPGFYEFDNLTPNPQNKNHIYINNSRTIINHLLDKAKYRFTQNNEIRGLTFYELLTIASIVEKEDAFDTHANVIASVFWNRLINNDRFSSCVTVEYILGYHRPFLLFSDLDKAAKSPYSTYHHKGIPPTPICFVSDYTLHNTINSDETDFYFFVLDWVEEVPYMSSDYEKHKLLSQKAKKSVTDEFGQRILRKKMDNYYYDYFSKNK